MVKIHSTLGSSSINSSEPRHFVVSDESEGDSAFQGQPMSNQYPQNPSNNGPVMFHSTDPVVPNPGQVPPQYAQQPQYTQPQYAQQQPPQGQPTEHGSYEEAMAYRRQYMEQKRVSDEQQVRGGRSNIEALIGIGRKFKDIPVESDAGNTVFRISTLKSKERQHVAQAMDTLLLKKRNEDIHNVRTVILSYCIVSIEGRMLDSVLGCNNLSEIDRYHIRESFVNELDDNIAAFLFSNFEQLDKESREKYSLKSSEDLKGVAEAISKSS